MPKNTKPMTKTATTSTRTTKRKPTAKGPRLLDEQTSAIVIAEYLAIEKVTEKETSAITDGPIRGGMTYRQIAVTFRISEVLDVPAPWVMAPRYRLAFKRAQNFVSVVGTTAGSLASTEAH